MSCQWACAGQTGSPGSLWEPGSQLLQEGHGVSSLGSVLRKELWWQAHVFGDKPLFLISR